MAKEDKYADEIMSDDELTFSIGSKNEEIRKGWASVGIEAKVSGNDDNQYCLNGQKITQ